MKGFEILRVLSTDLFMTNTFRLGMHVVHAILFWTKLAQTMRVIVFEICYLCKPEKLIHSQINKQNDLILNLTPENRL